MEQIHATYKNNFKILLFNGAYLKTRSQINIYASIITHTTATKKAFLSG